MDSAGVIHHKLASNFRFIFKVSAKLWSYGCVRNCPQGQCGAAGASVITTTADAKFPLLILRGWLSDVSRISVGCLGYNIYDVYGF